MIFVTGGAGYIGTHTCVELLAAGFEVTVFDNFSNSVALALVRAERISGKKIRLIEGDIRDAQTCARACAGVDIVLHQAALGSVPRSISHERRALLS